MNNQSKRRYDNRPSGWSAAHCSPLNVPMNIRFEHQVISLSTVMGYFTRGFEPKNGEKITGMEWYLDPVKQKVIFKITIQTPHEEANVPAERGRSAEVACSPFDLPPKEQWKRFRDRWMKILLSREDDPILRFTVAAAMRDILDDLTANAQDDSQSPAKNL